MEKTCGDMYQFLLNKYIIMKTILFLITSICLSCFSGKEKNVSDIKGIWIPKKINWKSGDFDTYYFRGDSSVVIISSVQRKQKDSILFNTEPGFNIKKGEIKFINNEFLISYKVIYRHIRIVDEQDKVYTEKVNMEPDGKLIRIDGVVYDRGNLYTNESKENIEKISTRMVSDIEEHPEKFN